MGISDPEAQNRKDYDKDIEEKANHPRGPPAGCKHLRFRARQRHGGHKVYGKFSAGDPDTSKTAASWFGACIFLIVSATILRSFFL